MDITGNPWSITTADAPFPKTVWRGNVHINQIEFMGYAADGNKCIITDLNGRIVWQGDGASDLETVRSGHLGTVMGGIIVTQLDSGAVRIFIR